MLEGHLAIILPSHFSLSRNIQRSTAIEQLVWPAQEGSGKLVVFIDILRHGPYPADPRQAFIPCLVNSIALIHIPTPRSCHHRYANRQ